MWMADAEVCWPPADPLSTAEDLLSRGGGDRPELSCPSADDG